MGGLWVGACGVVVVWGLGVAVRVVWILGGVCECVLVWIDVALVVLVLSCCVSVLVVGGIVVSGGGGFRGGLGGGGAGLFGVVCWCVMRRVSIVGWL